MPVTQAKEMLDPLLTTTKTILQNFVFLQKLGLQLFTRIMVGLKQFQLEEKNQMEYNVSKK